jgi:4-amino-4-deoxy-L-arabinose transferase-like glycosyltransferase
METVRPGIWRLDRLTAQNLFTRLVTLETGLFALGVIIYALTRLVALDRFPIYFFCDEAILVVRAEELLQNGLRSAEGRLLPTFMVNADRWNLGLPVYIQLISLALFGKSVVVTRATSAFISLIGVLAVAGTLKWVFKIRLWWAGVLVMAVIPTWLLHSRTAFDLVMMAAFYACFLCAYLLYRFYSPRFLYAALVFAAATSYSYPNGQAVVLASAVLLLLSDLRYHLRQPPRLILGVSLLAVALLLPLVRFLIEQPGAWGGQLRVINSYVVQPLPLWEKISTFLRLFSQGLDPRYWFLPSEVDWVRHRWAGLGHLGQYLLPFVAVGLGRALWQWRSPAHRAMLIAILAAPAGAALFRIEVTRTIAMVVPAALLAVIGLEQVYDWMSRLFKTSYTTYSISCAGLLSPHQPHFAGRSAG